MNRAPRAAALRAAAVAWSVVAASLLASPVDAQVARSVPVLAPGLPVVLGTADVWPAPDGSDGAVVVLPGPAAAPAAEIAARGHVVVAYRGRPAVDAERAAQDAAAFGELPGLAGRGGEAPVVVIDAEGLPRVLAALAAPAPPRLRAIVVDARTSAAAIEVAAVGGIRSLPPLLVLLDEAVEAPPAGVVRLLLAWRARGGDAQQATVGAPGGGLATVVDAYVRSRQVHRVPRFESMALAIDEGFERARATLAKDARRVVGMAAVGSGIRLGLDGPTARVLVEDGSAWRLDADFGRQRLVQFGAPRGGAPGDGPTFAATAVGERLLLRRHDPDADLWRPVAEWPVGAAVERVELHAVADGPLLAVADEGRVLRVWRIDASGAARSLAPPPGRLDAVATGHGLVAALSSAGDRQSLWIDVVGEWRAIADWARAPGAPMRALLASPDGSWLAFGADGGNLRIDPRGGVSRELDAAATLGALADASPTRPTPVVFVHPETGDPLSWRAAGWTLDGAALMLWREASGRHAYALATGLAHVDAALPIDAAGPAGGGMWLAGRDGAGRVRLLRGTLAGLRVPAGWWQADDPADGGVWLAHGGSESDLHRLDRGPDGRARWRVARGRIEGTAVVAEEPWSDPFEPGRASAPGAPDDIGSIAPHLDLDPARVASLCGPARVGIAAAVLVEGERTVCVRTGRLPMTPVGARARGLWRQSAAESAAMVGLSDAGPASSARDALVLLYRDAEGAARWRLGVADPIDGNGVAALAEPGSADAEGPPAGSIPAGLLLYRAGEPCGDAELIVEWRPFGEAARLTGLPRGLGARFVRADLPACY